MSHFKALLKKKGTGPTMSKSLWGDDFIELEKGFKDEAISLTRKATMLTALLTLEPNPEEKEWLSKVYGSPETYLPSELVAFITKNNAPHPLFDFTIKAIQHQDLTKEESTEAIKLVLHPETPEYLKAAFMEAERLKRESFDENKAFLDVFWDSAQRIESDIPVIVDIANAYDGFNRNIFMGPFIAQALASLGIHTVLHGVESVAPKFGMNAHSFLTELNIPIPTSLEDAHDQLKTQGWTYVDQSVSFPELHVLNQLRTNMVKRPVLATIEKFLHPIHSTSRHILITGYTHPAYKDMTSKLLSSANKAHEFVFFRGTEGSSQLSMDRRAPYVSGINGEISDGFVSPEDMGLNMYSKIEPEPTLTTKESLKRIKESLLAKQGLPYDILVYNASIIKSLVDTQPLSQEAVSTSLSESALALFK